MKSDSKNTVIIIGNTKTFLISTFLVSLFGGHHKMFQRQVVRFFHMLHEYKFCSINFFLFIEKEVVKREDQGLLRKMLLIIK